ncbi:hypothetical protein Fleli_1843 [Bernardetia litoralis DSM 6794]|uniref:Uncharacterized protein n=1 Tax=Bernardetia litoralis (strain ATCC 23117 / DSM 6794 / NBRC 15988 / NCIMB 1366 / Fx l1 / Sio-4) TaxID=880071 RepID=I4AJV6_BERLS|nr:hypothetical protein [Bernardetia litoralis]AFM04241.1 hypothetical protein Fleli_1843 [Bernardetia litoralis DSM 6794]
MWQIILKNFWTKCKRWLDIRLGYISAAPRLILYFIEILRYGAYTVDTEFEYVSEDGAKTEKFIMRMLITLDGDITNFVPNPMRYQDNAWLFCFENALQTHSKNIDFFFTKLEQSAAFWTFLTTVPAIIAINYRLVQDIWIFFTTGHFSDKLQDQILEIGLFAASAILLPQVVKLLIPRLLAFALKRIEAYLLEEEVKK